MVAVRDELRRGNLWVEGSRRYRQLADFFLPEPEWTARRADFFSRARLPAKAEDGGRFLARRLAAAYDRFQSRFPENAQVKVTEDGWRLSSDVAERRSPEEQQALERLTSWMGAHMRSIRLPDLLIEVDNELDWSRHFIPPSRRRKRSVQDICEVVASVMAYGCNIDPETMARVTNDVSYKAIRRLADWQFSEDKLRGALADLVNGISRCDAAEVWGHARTSSSDGQRYLFPRKTLKATYGHRLGDYALEFYTFVADNYAPFYSTPIECTERDAAYVLDGLLYHESEIDPEEHYTDTHGYTELNFAAFAMLGRRFCPRIRSVRHQRLYRIDRDRDYGILTDLVARADHTIDIEVIQGQWERMGQFYSSLVTGHTTAFFSYLGPACRTLTERNYASWSHRHSCVCRNPGPGRDEKHLLSSGKRRVSSVAAYGSWISPCRPQVRCQDGAPSRPIAATLTGSFPPTPALDHQTVRHEGCRVCEV